MSTTGVTSTNKSAPITDSSRSTALATLPRENAASRSNMSTFAARLVENRTITQLQNGPSYSIYEHKLSAAVVFTMFYNIMSPLVFVNFHTEIDEVATLDVITQSIAYDALLNTYAVLYHKASRVSFGLTGAFGQAAPFSNNEFPIFVTALINSIGPVQFRGVPARGLHVPYLVFTEIEAQTPPKYAPFYVGMFKEAIAQSGSYALGAVDVMTSESSPWWTFHTYVERDTVIMDKLSLWSPVKFDDCDNVLKLGTLFAKSYLTTSVGVIHFSSTPFYDVNDPPDRRSFPPDAFDFPYFVKTQPAYYEFLERSPASNDSGSPSNHPQPPTTESSTSSINDVDTPPRTTHCDTSQRSTRKRKLTDSSTAEAGDGVVLHRIVYHYFDHQAAKNIRGEHLDAWSFSLNSV